MVLIYIKWTFKDISEDEDNNTLLLSKLISEDEDVVNHYCPKSYHFGSILVNDDMAFHVITQISFVLWFSDGLSYMKDYISHKGLV